jgi:hypothetical protein
MVRIELAPADIKELVQRGYLGPDDREDLSAIEFAATAFISDAGRLLVMRNGGGLLAGYVVTLRDLGGVRSWKLL